MELLKQNAMLIIATITLIATIVIAVISGAWIVRDAIHQSEMRTNQLIVESEMRTNAKIDELRKDLNALHVTVTAIGVKVDYIHHNLDAHRHRADGAVVYSSLAKSDTATADE